MNDAENSVSVSCLPKDSTESESNAGARSGDRPESRETGGTSRSLLERIVSSENLNKAYKRVKANKGAPGVDGMTVEEVLTWLREHGKEMVDKILTEKYKPDPVTTML